jgi:hypothetical protein
MSLITALLALLLAAPATAEDYVLPPPPTVGSHVDYWADKAEFDGERSIMHLTGHVTMKQSTMTVRGDDIWIDDANRTGRSDKPVLVDDGVSAVYGDSGDFDFGKQTGRLFHSSAGMGNWRIHAREARLLAERKTKYRTADYTSCDRIPPDYHFHSSTLNVVPKQYILGWNTLFYLGPVPLFYTPFFYHSLDPDPLLKWQFQPGTDSRNGDYIKGTLTTRYSTSTYSKLYDDYYSNMGYGYGGELNHHSGDNSNGGLFAYRIHEDGTVNDRWGFLGSDYQRLSRTISFQGRLQTQSDATFNNDYNRSNLFRLTPELVNSAALTKSIPQGVLHLSYLRTDDVNPATNRYTRSSEDLPRIDFQGNPFRIYKLPWLNTITAFADDNYTIGRGYQQKSVGATWDATRSFHVARGVTYTPKLDYSETYYNQNNEQNWSPSILNPNLNSTQGVWTTTNNLRFATLLGHLDVTHTYSQRMKPDAWTEDTGPTDKGVVANSLGFTDTFVPTVHTWARITTSYDFRTFRDHVETFNQRISPIVTDASWQPKPKLIFTFHDAYVITNSSGAGSNQSVIADMRWGDPLKGPSIGGGVSYNLATPASYYQTLEFAFSPSSPTWRVTVALRVVDETNGGFRRLHSGRLFEKEVTWTRTWHDFYTKVIFRERPGGVGEVTGQVQFRFGDTNPQHAPRRDWGADWMPGRTGEEDQLR